VGDVGELDGLVAVVTGGSSGIGLATARLLRDRGARVAVLDLSSPPDEDALSFVVADVSDDASVRAAVASVAGDLGGIDIVVNNAGIGAQGTVEDNDDDEWRRVLEVNLLGMVRVSRAALPYLRRSAHAAIVNVCSVVATAGVPNRALYSASKGAVLSLTLAMAADHVREGIRVNCVNPGTADTPWIERLLAAAPSPAAERAALEARQPRAGWCPRRRSPPRSPIWRARRPARRPGRLSRWTAGCRACGFVPSRREHGQSTQTDALARARSSGETCGRFRVKGIAARASAPATKSPIRRDVSWADA
jgi:NAD(P)-dependent dehydrogenase (short-subunit alcohol dehydrogenase family)